LTPAAWDSSATSTVLPMRRRKYRAVMGYGFSGTQDRLFAGAERFAAAGMAALTFDDRNFGESTWT
jgi:hypothetical protein